MHAHMPLFAMKESFQSVKTIKHVTSYKACPKGTICCKEEKKKNCCWNIIQSS